MLIRVFDVVGQNCITADAGKHLYDLIAIYLQDGYQIELDFINVEFAVSRFFNAFPNDLFFDSNVAFVNMPYTVREIIKKIRLNAQ